MSTRFFGRGAALTLLASAIGLTMVIAVGLIAFQVLGPQPVVDLIACELGLSTDCLQEELEQKRRRLKKLEERTAELEALYDRLAKLEYASESFVVFYTDREGKREVTSAHRYASLIAPDRLVGGWCYIDLPSVSGISRNFFIAKMSADRIVRPTNPAGNVLASAGVSNGEVAQALSRCHWPEGVS